MDYYYYYYYQSYSHSHSHSYSYSYYLRTLGSRAMDWASWSSRALLAHETASCRNTATCTAHARGGEC